MNRQLWEEENICKLYIPQKTSIYTMLYYKGLPQLKNNPISKSAKDTKKYFSPKGNACDK